MFITTKEDVTLLDFNRMRQEHNPYTIDHFDVTSGDIYSSDQIFWLDKWKDHYLDYLPKKLTSSDGVEIHDDQMHNPHSGNSYWPNYRKSSEAVRRRYIRTAWECKDGIKRSNFIVIDHDKPFGHEDWIGRLPAPQLVVINPVSARCHLIYVLDGAYDVSFDLFKTLSTRMLDAIGAEKATPVSFRSPFFITGRRKTHEEFRKGMRQSDYHFVIHHECEPYSLFKLVEEFISLNRSTGNDDNALTDTVVSRESFNDPNTQVVTTSRTITPDIGIRPSGGHSDSVVLFEGRNDRLFDALRKIAYSIGSSITYQECLATSKEQNNILFSSHPHGVLPPSEVRSIAKSVFGFMQNEFVGTKKTALERHKHGVFAANTRWLYQKRIVGELLVDAAQKFDRSLRTVRRWKAKGTIQFIDKKWQMSPLGPNSNPNSNLNETLIDAAKRFCKSLRTLKRWKASGKVVLIDGLWQLASLRAHADFIKGRNDDQIDYHQSDLYSCDYDPNQWTVEDKASAALIRKLAETKTSRQVEFSPDTPERQPVTLHFNPLVTDERSASDELTFEEMIDGEYEQEASATAKTDENDEFAMLWKKIQQREAKMKRVFANRKELTKNRGNNL
jgi:hypothetical protein